MNFAEHTGSTATMPIATWSPDGTPPNATIYVRDVGAKVPWVLHSPTYTAHSIDGSGVVDAGATVLLLGQRQIVTLLSWDPNLIA